MREVAWESKIFRNEFVAIGPIIHEEMLKIDFFKALSDLYKLQICPSVRKSVISYIRYARQRVIYDNTSAPIMGSER